MPYADPEEQKAYFKRYWAEHRQQANVNKTNWRKKNRRWRSKKMAKCHPERPLYSNDLCRSCYNAELNIKPHYIASNKKRKERWFTNKWDRRFGWLPGTHKKLLEQQELCDLCHLPFGNKKKHTDHDHTTGKFRGIIHGKCNTGIGFLGDSEELCLLAAAYLRKNK